VEIGRQVCLLCSWARHLTELLLPFQWLDCSITWKLDSKTKMVTSLSPGQGTLIKKNEDLNLLDASTDTPIYIFTVIQC